ncbi:hypothetical protein PNO31109_04055 [Pandoraea nosoerga]|uniref:Uncharacterized protein n=1 Tax=Pandoraea nosoerga TaxID=2508296 RepID=A0A5E4XSQ8_9BURK|nr:hypothetical protein PNO31109_04055 [Pandoraea nosoerga]
MNSGARGKARGGTGAARPAPRGGTGFCRYCKGFARPPK